MRNIFNNCTVVMGILYCLPVIVSSWTLPVNISNSWIRSSMGSMAIDRNGKIHVVWSEWWDPDLDHDIYYSYSTDNGATWSTPANICDDNHISVGPQIVIDSLNTIHVFWDDGYGSTPILWTHDSAGTWATPVNIAAGSPGGEYLTAEIDSLNRIWVFWHEYYGQIWYSFFDGNSWLTPQQATNETVDTAFPDAFVDDDNIVHLVWKKYGDYYTDNDVYYCKYIDTVWTPPEKVESLPGQSCEPKIRLDSQKRPWVIWQERYSGGYFLYYTYKDTSGWLPPTLIANEDRFIHDFIIDLGDYLHLFWATGPLWHSMFNGLTWSPSIVISDTLSGNSFCEDVLIDSDMIHLIFRNNPRPSGDTSNVYYIQHDLTGVNELPKQPGPSMQNFNFPNPFKKKTEICYHLDKPGDICLTISDSAGRIIYRIDLGYMSKGYHIFRLYQDFIEKGGDIAPGIYFYYLFSGREGIAKGKIVIIQ